MKANTVDAFSALVRAGLFPVHGEGLTVNVSFYKDVDWGKVYQLAAEQSVLGLVLAGMEQYKNLNANLKRKADRIMGLVLESGNFGHNKNLSYRSRYSGMTYKIVAA